jgi:plastocyanin
MESNLTKQNKLMMVAGAVVVVLIIIIISLINQTKKTQEENKNLISAQKKAVTTTPINDNVQDEGTVVVVPENASAATKEILKDAKIEVSGGSIVTKDDKVVNNQGVEVKNDAAPMTSAAPRLSDPIKVSDLAASDIKLKATATGFTPSEFTVKSGTAITIALTSEGTDSRLVFDDNKLIALELPVPIGYTMAKTFNAPAPGEYTFRQDIPGRSSQTGKMIVK